MKSNSTRQNFHLGAWELCEDVSLQGEDAQNEGPVAQQEPEQMDRMDGYLESDFKGPWAKALLDSTSTDEQNLVSWLLKWCPQISIKHQFLAELSVS